MTIDSKANSSSATSTSTATADAPILPDAWPLLGHFVPMLRAGLLNFLVAARDAGPVVVVRLGPLRAYLINDHHWVRRVLVIDGASYVRGRVFQQARDFLGNGLVTSEETSTGANVGWSSRHFIASGSATTRRSCSGSSQSDPSSGDTVRRSR